MIIIKYKILCDLYIFSLNIEDFIQVFSLSFYHFWQNCSLPTSQIKVIFRTVQKGFSVASLSPAFESIMF